MRQPVSRNGCVESAQTGRTGDQEWNGCQGKKCFAYAGYISLTHGRWSEAEYLINRKILLSSPFNGVLTSSLECHGKRFRNIIPNSLSKFAAIPHRSILGKGDHVGALH